MSACGRSTLRLQKKRVAIVHTKQGFALRAQADRMSAIRI